MPGLASISKSLFNRFGERKATCSILELNGQDQPAGDYIAFQYFPETITDTKAINYNTRDIPGGSLPIYQWISSGERIIQFTALFTADVDLLQNPDSVTKLKANGQLIRNVDLRSAVLWLRRYMLPRYSGDAGLGVPLTLAPRKMILRIPNSGLGLQGGGYGISEFFTGSSAEASQTDFVGTGNNAILPDSIPCIMTQCDVTWEQFFPSGLPRIATVQLQFAQIAQLQGTVNFPRDSDDLAGIVSKGVNSQNRAIYPYNIKAVFK